MRKMALALPQCQSRSALPERCGSTAEPVPSSGRHAAYKTPFATLLEEIACCILVRNAGFTLGHPERSVEVLVLDAEAVARGVQGLPVVQHVAAQVEIDARFENCLSHVSFSC